MTDKYVSPGGTINAVAPSGGFTNGVLAVLGDATLAMPDKTVAEGDIAVLHKRGRWNVACVSGDDISQGDTLYWDTDPGVLTVTATGNYLAGHAATDAGVGVTTVELDLNDSPLLTQEA